MNTSKQINAMIGLLFLTILVLGAYAVNEGKRQTEAREEQAERIAERGARTFVQNCRSCHGMEGLGPEEGAVAPALNNAAFLILGEHNEYDLPATSDGVAAGIRTFLGNTITCGRAGTFMPTWALDFGGPLSAQRIEQLVVLMTDMRWDLVEEQAAEIDEETGATAEDIVIKDASTLALTQSNCGQYNAITALPFRTREDPRLASGEPAATPSDGAAAGTETPAAGAPATVQGLPVVDFFQASCTACHGADRGGIPGLGLPLTPSALTQPDDVYFQTIAEGREGTVMPSWRATGLSDDEMRTLVEFITTVEP